MKMEPNHFSAFITWRIAEKAGARLQLVILSLCFPWWRWWGTILDKEMCYPTLLDQNDKPCLTVTEDSSTTGMTSGCASGIMSSIQVTSRSTLMMIAMKPPRNWPSSHDSNSGTVIVDSLGHYLELTWVLGTLELSRTSLMWLLNDYPKILSDLPNKFLNDVQTSQ